MLKEIDKRKFFVFLIFGLLFVSLSLSCVAGQEDETPILEKIPGWYDGWAHKIGGWDTFGITITYIVGAIIVGAFLSSVLGFFVSSKKEWISTTLGFIVGTAFVLIIRPEEIFGILISFKSIGLSFLSVVPLAILGLFSIQARIKNNSVHIFIGTLLWVVYGIYVVAQAVIKGVFQGQFATMTWVIVGVNLIIAVLFIIMKIDKVIASIFIGSQQDAARDGAARLREKLITVGTITDKVAEGAKEAGG
ncbi:MAG: hypothetical protein ACP5D2_04730 [Candidatus Nanoarchaeia archaeon]